MKSNARCAVQSAERKSPTTPSWTGLECWATAVLRISLQTRHGDFLYDDNIVRAWNEVDVPWSTYALQISGSRLPKSPSKLDFRGVERTFSPISALLALLLHAVEPARATL